MNEAFLPLVGEKKTKYEYEMDKMEVSPVHRQISGPGKDWGPAGKEGTLRWKAGQQKPIREMAKSERVRSRRGGSESGAVVRC